MHIRVLSVLKEVGLRIHHERNPRATGRRTDTRLRRSDMGVDDDTVGAVRPVALQNPPQEGCVLRACADQELSHGRLRSRVPVR